MLEHTPVTACFGHVQSRINQLPFRLFIGAVF